MDELKTTGAARFSIAGVRGQDEKDGIFVRGQKKQRTSAESRTPIGNQVTAPEGSDDALALEFADQYEGVFHWSSAMGWLHNCSTHFAPDSNLKRYDRARAIARKAANMSGKEAEARRIASSKTTTSILTLAQSDPRVVVDAAEWDADPFALNTPGGIVDLKTGIIRSHRGDLVTQIARTCPDFKASRSLWAGFLDGVFEGDAAMIEFMQRLVGYTLTADRREQKLFFMYGMGANGKSTFWDAIQWIAGTYALKLPASTLMRTSSDRHPTELAQLFRKRLAISSEPDEGQHWNEARIKELTGDETLAARFMRQDFFEFRQTQKHILIGNYRPRLQGGDAAMARRLVLVNFNATFAGRRRDKDLPTKLRREAPSVLAWMVEGAIKWQQDGLCVPASVTASSNEYMGDNDDLALWLSECCDIDVLDVQTKAALLYESFTHWIRARGQHPLAQRTWGERMASLKGISKVKNSSIQYRGIRLKDVEIQRMNASIRRDFT